MKVIIAGSRTYKNYNELKQICDFYLRNQKSVEIVSGGAKGADLLGERYAKERGLKIKVFTPDWERFGKKAGIIRNEEMAKYADGLIAFWDGQSRGTKHMIEYAKLRGLKVRVFEFKP
jgi:hypothetical protein